MKLSRTRLRSFTITTFALWITGPSHAQSDTGREISLNYLQPYLNTSGTAKHRSTSMSSKRCHLWIMGTIFRAVRVRRAVTFHVRRAHRNLRLQPSHGLGIRTSRALSDYEERHINSFAPCFRSGGLRVSGSFSGAASTLVPGEFGASLSVPDLGRMGG